MRAVELTHTPEIVNERTLIFVQHGSVNDQHDSKIPIPPQVLCERQVGWLGHDGQVYAMDEEPEAQHAGDRCVKGVPYSPLYIEIGTD